MYPELLRFATPDFLKDWLPPYIVVHSYGFMILLGILCAYLYVRYRSKEFGLDNDLIAELFLWCFAGVFVGGKLFFYLEDPGSYLQQPSLLFSNLGAGFVFYGSFLFTLPLLYWFFRKNKLPVLPMFDLVAVGGTFVHGLGKIGCFLSGCCHGKVCAPGQGIVFTDPRSSAEPLNTPLYPVQLYDALLILCIAALLVYLYPRRKFYGQLILLYAILYGTGRTITEIYRGDEERGYIIEGVLTHSQLIALAILVASAGLWYRWSRTQKITRT